jgi:hypothetical protein
MRRTNATNTCRSQLCHAPTEEKKMSTLNDSKGSDNNPLEHDKTQAYHPGTDPYANQGGGKEAGGNHNSGNPANDPAARRELGEVQSVELRNPENVDAGAIASGSHTRSSGNPPLSEAGKRADDRPGHASPDLQNRPLKQ